MGFFFCLTIETVIHFQGEIQFTHEKKWTIDGSHNILRQHHVLYDLSFDPNYKMAVQYWGLG